MTIKAFGISGTRRAGKLFLASAALLLISIIVACSDSPPSASPTAADPSPTPEKVAPTATSAPPPATVPATPIPTATGPAPTATAEPTTVPTPPPTSPPPTPEPTATPEAAPEVSEAVSAAAEEVYGLLTELVDDLGHRVAGTPQELVAAEILRDQFEAFGYSAQLQPFSFEYFDLIGFIQGQRELATINVQSPIQMTFPGIPLTTAPSGAEGAGSLVPVPLKAAQQVADADLEGKVALIQAGEISLADPAVVQGLQGRVNEVAAAGAVAAIVDGSSATGMQGYRPLYGATSPIPALMVPPAPPGATNPMSQAPPGIDIVVSVEIQTRIVESNNVIAELKGEGDGVVVVGAHYDIVPQTKLGPNDNASGNAIVLSLAKALAEESLPFTVKFIHFGAEEVGLRGSGYYVSSLPESELGRIKAMINFDVVGTGPHIAVVGNEALTSLALEAASNLGINAQPGRVPPGATSDHQSFEQAGVPVMMAFAPDVSRIHTPNDKLEFVQPERLGEAFLIAEAMLLSPQLAQ